MVKPDFDCAVIGAGIAGATTALVLSQLGHRVIVLERARHPRFAIGEGMLPTGTLLFDHLATRYRLPELRRISHYPGLRGLGLPGWPKMQAWFGHHTGGQRLRPGDEVLLATPGLPVGPDVHVVRADADAYLTRCARERGVEVLEGVNVVSAAFEAGGARLSLEGGGAPAEVRARFVIDCSGHASTLARQLGLRDESPRLATDSRAIFAHFEGVPPLEGVVGEPCPLFEKVRDAGTLHHVFKGGWFWVIPFDNDTTSVGLMLDRSEHPDDGRSAEDELKSFIERFPLVREHLGGARPVRPLKKTGRVQFTSSGIAAERLLLAPHAAGFVDPLFSTGILLSVAFVARAAPLVGDMLERDSFEPARMAGLERVFADELAVIDRIVHGMYRSFRHADTFKQYWRTWVYGSIVQYFTHCVGDPARGIEPLGLYGSSFPTWRRQLDRMYAIVTADERDDARVAAELKRAMDEYVEPFAAEDTNWAIGSAEPCRPYQGNRACIPGLIEREPELAERVRARCLVDPRSRREPLSADVMMSYWESKGAGGTYHEGVDRIDAMALKVPHG